MKIFISMKVPHADANLHKTADMLAETISSAGYQPFVATDEISERGLSDPNEFMPFVRKNLRNADLLILLYHPELHGGLIEAGVAYAWQIPIWLCHRPGDCVSSSMRGCADVTIEYEGLNNLREKLLEKII